MLNFHDNLVHVCVCVLVCVCVFISFYCKGFSWLSKTIHVGPEFSSTMLCWGNSSVPSTFVATSWTITVEIFKLATVQRVSIKPGNATRSKRQLFKTFSKPTIKVQSITTLLLTNLGSRSAAAQGKILANCTTPRGVL